MKLVFLDRKSIGEDIDFSPFHALGDVDIYSFTTPEEVPERIKDADVIVVNKIPINEQTIGSAERLKLVCVTATGTNNLDKDGRSLGRVDDGGRTQKGSHLTVTAL